MEIGRQDQIYYGPRSRAHPNHIGQFQKMHPSNILHTRPTIPTISLQCQPRQTTWVLVLDSKEHMVSMLQIETQSVPETIRRHNNNRTIAIQDKGILSLHRNSTGDPFGQPPNCIPTSWNKCLDATPNKPITLNQQQESTTRPPH